MPNRLFRWGRFPSAMAKRVTVWAAAGSNGYRGLRRSTNKGTTFSRIQPSFEGRCVFQHSNGDIYSGDYGNIWRSTDGGVSFVSVLDKRTEHIHYHDGYFYASCEASGLYRSSSGDANSWSNIPIEWWNQVWHSFIDDDGTIYLSTPDGIRKSTDDGANWTAYKTENGLIHNMMTHVLVDSHGTIWATSGRDVDGGVNKSTDGGATWTTYNVATAGISSNDVRSLAYDPVRDRIYIACFGGSDERGVDYTDDGGATWSHPDPHDNHVQFYRLYYCDGTVYASGSKGASWSDNGTSWTSIKFPYSTYEWRDIFARVELVEPAIEHRCYMSDTNANWAFTEDDGVTWTHEHLSEGALATFFPDDMSWGIRNQGAGQTYAGTYPWATWDGSSSVLNTYCRRFVRSSGGELYAAGDRFLFVSTDADHTGDSWALFHDDNFAGDLRDLAMQGSTWLAPRDQGGTWVTTDGGTTCNLRTSAHGMMTGAHACVEIAGSTLWAGGVNGVCKSTDGGASWTTYTTSDGLAHNNSVGMVYHATTGRLFVVSNDATSGGISYTDDSGANWSTITLTNSKLLNGIRILDNRIYVYSVVSAGGSAIAHSDDNGSNWEYCKSYGIAPRYMHITRRS